MKQINSAMSVTVAALIIHIASPVPATYCMQQKKVFIKTAETIKIEPAKKQLGQKKQTNKQAPKKINQTRRKMLQQHREQREQERTKNNMYERIFELAPLAIGAFILLISIKFMG